jgi:hypothetical protein
MRIGYDDLPNGFKRVVEYLLASLAYHLNRLRATLPENHDIWSKRIFRAFIELNGERQLLLEYLRDKVITGIGLGLKTLRSYQDEGDWCFS